MKTIREDEHKNTRSYPKLMICDSTGSDGGMVVLMRTCGVGTVVHSTTTCDKGVGYHSETWCMNCFLDFSGKVIMEN